MFTVGFGRVNIPHLGHKKYIDMCDVFILTEGEAKNKLPAEIRYKAISTIYPTVANKLLITNLYKYLDENKENITVLCPKENAKLAESLKIKVSDTEKFYGLSSTKIRGYIDTNNLVELKKVYDKDTDIEELYNLRKLEVLKCQGL